MAKRKCQICGEWIEDNADSVVYKKGYAHRNCFNVAMKVITSEKKETLASKKIKQQPKPQKELKEGLSEEEYREKKALCDYIRCLISEDISVVNYKLMEDYKKKYNISFREMHDDLKWYFDLLGHEVSGDTIVAIIPSIHTEAQKYYLSIQQSNKSCQENISKLPQMYKEKQAVASNERRGKIPQIDLAAIGGEK